MMRDLLAFIFRSSNNNLIFSSPAWVFKWLKGIHFMSRMAYLHWEILSGTTKVITNFDRRLKLSLHPSHTIGGSIYWTGFHELREMIFLHHYLLPDMVFADIGANLGEFTVFCASRLPQGKVLAFEPLPVMLDQLRTNVKLNQFNHVEVVPCGLSDQAGTVSIFTPNTDANEGLASVFKNDGMSATQRIELRTLDEEMLRLKLNRLDVIKMDIEGSELFALKGARKTLERYRPCVIVEINDKTFKAAGYEVHDIANFFDGLGYKPHQLGKRGELILLETLPSFGNVVFLNSSNRISQAS